MFVGITQVAKLLLFLAVLHCIVKAVPFCFPGSGYTTLENDRCWNIACPQGWVYVPVSVYEGVCKPTCPPGYTETGDYCNRPTSSTPCPPDTTIDGPRACKKTLLRRDSYPPHDLITDLPPVKTDIGDSSLGKDLVVGNAEIEGIPSQIGISTLNLVTEFLGVAPIPGSQLFGTVVPLLLSTFELLESTKSQTSAIVEQSRTILDASERKIIQGDLDFLLSRQEVINRFLALFEYQNLTLEYKRAVGFAAASELTAAVTAFEGKFLSKRPLETGPALISVLRAFSLVALTIEQNPSVFSSNGESPEVDEVLHTAMRARELVTRYLGGSILRRREGINDDIWRPDNDIAHCVITDRNTNPEEVYKVKFDLRSNIFYERAKTFCNERAEQYKHGMVKAYDAHYHNVTRLLHIPELLRIRTGERLRSKDRMTYAIMQPDGNFVVYEKHGTNRNVIWHTGTHTKTGFARPFRVELSSNDGVLRIFDRNNMLVWSNGAPLPQENKPYRFLVVRRNLEIRDGNNALVWKADVTQNHTYEENSPLQSSNGACFTMVQDDGHFVLYCKGKARWASQTPLGSDNPYSLLVQGHDGNIHVMRRGGLYSHWNARVSRTAHSYTLKMQNDQNLVLYQYDQNLQNETAVWSTGTNV